MRKVFVAIFLAAAMSCTPALAQSAMFNWSGFYVGGYAGYGWGRTTSTDIGDSAGTPWYVLGSKTSAKPDSFVGGGQAGFNVQSGNWVWGAEADFGSLRLSGHKGIYGGDTFVTTDSSYDATFRARFGYAVDRSLFFVTGGGILANFNSMVSRPTTAFFTTDTGSQWGWTIGGGWEYALDAVWSIKAEYLYYDVAKKQVNSGPGGNRWDIENTGNLVRLGINYKFGAR